MSGLRRRGIGPPAYVLGLLLPILTVLGSMGHPIPTSPDVRKTLDSFSCSSLLNQTGINTSVSAIYAHTANSNSWANQTSVDSATWSTFIAACANATFQSLAQSWGSGNFSFDLQSVGPSSGNSPSTAGLAFANFTFDWRQWSSGSLLSDREWWAGNLTTASVSGPFTLSSFASMWNEGHQSTVWAGYEWYNATNSFGPKVLNGESGWTTTLAFTNPSCCQVGVPTGETIDPIAVVWTGLNATSGAHPRDSGASLQVGYAYDAASPTSSWCTGGLRGCDYGFYHERSGAPAMPYTGAPHAKSGQVLQEQVFQSNATSNCAVKGVRMVWWISQIVDLAYAPKGVHTHMDCMELLPKYAPMIYDSPQAVVVGVPHYQQTASFGTVEFQSGYVWTGWTPVVAESAANLYPGQDNIFTMNERSGFQNTREAFSGNCGVQYVAAVATSCQDTQYQNANYDYGWV
jgi:hypothetical protein